MRQNEKKCVIIGGCISLNINRKPIKSLNVPKIPVRKQVIFMEK
jgi:hypothetical protein